MPAPFTVALTWIDHRLTDVIFATRQQIEEILALDAPTSSEEWPGRIIQWLQTGRIGWDKEAAYRLPVAAWREMMDRYFPDSAWLRLRREQFDALCAYRARHSLVSWEATVEVLLRDE